MVLLRTREIGIRKVLGASVGSITVMLLRVFLLWIAFANLIGWPLAYYVMTRWLQGFAYHIDIQGWMFLLAAVLSLLVGIITVVWHALRAALSDPVEAVRYE